MRRIRLGAALVLGLMGLSFGAGVWASNGIEKVEAFLRPDFKVLVDGKEANLGKPVLVYNDTSYVPLKKVGELLGANVFWKDETHSIYINPRFPGQPEQPMEDSDYKTIDAQHPIAYQMEYLGGSYVLVMATTNYNIYYRVDDLALMGVDVRGLVKVKDINTGALFASREDVEKLWKETPSYGYSLKTLVAGTTDPALIKLLQDFAMVSLPELGKTGYFPKVSNVSFIDAVKGHPGWFALYANDMKGELILFMLEMAQDKNGAWYQKSVATTTLGYYQKFFDPPKK